MDVENTSHDGGALGHVHHVGEVHSALPDLYPLLATTLLAGLTVLWAIFD